MLDGSAGPLTAQARECAANIQDAGRHLLRQVEAWHRRVGDRAGAVEPGVELVGLIRAKLAGRAGNAGMAAAEWAAVGAPVLLLRGDAKRLERLAEAVADLVGVGSDGPAPVKLSVDDCGMAAISIVLKRRDRSVAALGALPSARLAERLAADEGGAVAYRDGALVLLWPSRRVLERRL